MKANINIISTEKRSIQIYVTFATDKRCGLPFAQHHRSFLCTSVACWYAYQYLPTPVRTWISWVGPNCRFVGCPQRNPPYLHTFTAGRVWEDKGCGQFQMEIIIRITIQILIRN